MVAETHFMQGRLYSEIEEAVEAGFKESGLEKSVLIAGGLPLILGLKGYVIVLLGGFMHRDAMYVKYQTQRAEFAALAGDYYFDAVLGHIQQGDLALFHGGLFFAGVYRQSEAAKAGEAYRNVFVLLRGARKERQFFDFMQAHTPEVMDGLSATALHLNIPRQRETLLYMPAVERYLGMN